MSSMLPAGAIHHRAGGFVSTIPKTLVVTSLAWHHTDVKLALVLISLFALVCTGCKLEPSAATPNRNVNANASTQAATSENQEAKANCPLRIAAAPVVYGLKLGMTPDEVLARFPESKDDAEIKALRSRPPSQFGGSELVIHPQKYKSKEEFVGVDHINFSFLDGHAHTINVGYTGPAYPHVDDFIKKLVAGTNMPPPDQWQAYPGQDTQMKTLTCQDFAVRVFAGGEGGNLNYVLLTDLEAEKTLKNRRAKAKAQAKPTTSP